jgi:competence protein ComEC
LVVALFLALVAGAFRSSLTAQPLNESQLAFYGNDQEVTIQGVVLGEPAIYERRIELTVDIESIRLPGQPTQPADGRLLVQTLRFPIIPYGTRLQLTGNLETPDSGLDFDYKAYLARRGIQRLMPYPELLVLAQDQANPLYHRLYQFKEQARKTISQLLPDPQAALLTGILLGDDSRIPRSLQDDFRKTGMSHIIAISGFNIAILAGVLLRGSRSWLGLRSSAGFALLGISLYTLLVGADAAVVRAAIMGGIYILTSRLLGRPTFAPAVLALAAFGMSLVNPHVLWDIGFQLSFAATLGLMLYAEPLSRRTRNWLETWLPPEWVARLMPFIAETILVTLAAQVATLPLLIYHFGQLSLASLPANLLILPAQPGVMLWGGLATLVGMVFPALGQLLAGIAWLFLTYTIELVQILARMPFAVIDVQVGLPGVIALYAALIGVTWLLRQAPQRRQQLWESARLRSAHGAIGASFLLLLLTWQWHQTQPDGLLHVAFLNVGQGDAVFIQTPQGRQMLVDGGHYPALLRSQLGRQMPFWDRTLDVVVATHPDDDHVAGLPGVFDRYDVDLLLTNGAEEDSSSAYEALLQQAKEGETTMHAVQAGQTMQLDQGVHIEFLHPGPVALEKDNDNSVALRLTYGNFSLLLTGDAEQEAELAMLQREAPLEALVFKAGHHGARTSSNDFFLEAVQPRIVVISSGKENQWSHPHPEVLERAAAVGATVLRTDEMGTIEVVTDGERMWWEVGR